jgi:serine/alanine adding enzyme
MKVELAQDGQIWDEFVGYVAPDHLYYLWSWRDVIERSFGHQPYYLTAYSKGQVCGVLPLFSLRSRLFQRRLVSIPFCSHGGVLAETDEIRDKLLDAACKLALQLGAQQIELRQRERISISWQDAPPKVTMEIQLNCNTDQFWKRLSSGMRNKIRQGQKHGLRAEWGGLEKLSVFHNLFAINMRNLGTPVYSLKFFENQIRRFPDRIRILTLWDKDDAVAASFLTAHRDTLELPWSASTAASRKQYSHVLMYWIFIQQAISEGFKSIDLGRCTPGSGTYEFKRHWNPVERRLHWYYWLAPGASVSRLSPDNGKFRLAIKIWKRLPLAVANRLGPYVVRSIP